MQYKTSGVFESAVWATQYALLTIGVVGLAWSLFNPGGWFNWLIALIAEHQTASYYYLALALASLLAGPRWLNQAKPNVILRFLNFGCAFAGTYFILLLVQPL